MFDIGFWEIVLIGIVALLVVGPDKFPGLIRDIARWSVRIRRFVVDTKRDIEREIRIDDLKKDLDPSFMRMDHKPAPVADTKPAPAKKDPPDAGEQPAA